MSQHANRPPSDAGSGSDEPFFARLRRHAREQPDATAFVELGDGETETARITFGELDRRARAVAARLDALGCRGRAVLVAIENGIAFVTAFVGCLHAGAVAVPLPAVASQRTRERLAAVARDAGPRAVLIDGLGARSPARDGELEGLPVVDVATMDEAGDDAREPPPVDAAAIAFVQYSSGSTATPRGFAISHGALTANQAMMRAALGHDRSWRSVSWLPPHHDMGLVGGILQPLAEGALGVLLPTLRVVQKPMRWLRAIDRWRGSVSTGPTFMYEACVTRVSVEERAGLDLASWRVACCGAEPVDAGVLDAFVAAYAAHGFAPGTLYPCYGLAEATLFMTGGRSGDGMRAVTVDRAALGQGRIAPAGSGLRLVACGRPWAGARLHILGADGTPAPAGAIGEIYIGGPSLTSGIWSPDGPPRPITRLVEGEPCVRSGDLGFLDRDDLVPVGRCDDIVIVRGVNHHPDDIERTALAVAAATAPLGCAAFAIPAGLAVAVEIGRSAARAVDGDDLARRIADRVAADHGMRPAMVLVLREGGLPRTTSGKIQRHRCREGLADGSWPRDVTVVARRGDAG
ncbi:MAG: fatty acyl-AMP ligase [Alphaproteobacteria bacterium]|nr:fatty acyl-AMP ligase [Alphaproteobacteria bacterium]